MYIFRIVCIKPKKSVKCTRINPKLKFFIVGCLGILYVKCCVCQVLCMSGGGAGTSQDVVNQIVNTVKCCVCQVVELELARMW